MSITIELLESKVKEFMARHDFADPDMTAMRAAFLGIAFTLEVVTAASLGAGENENMDAAKAFAVFMTEFDNAVIARLNSH